MSTSRRGQRAIGVLVALAVALAVAMGFLRYVEGQGPWTSAATRHLRAMKERTEAPDSVESMTFQEFEALPRGRPWTTTALIERRGVRVEGWLTRVRHATDGDLHLDLSPEPGSTRGQDYIVAEITPQWRQGRWSDRRLLPALGADTAAGAAPRVRLTGWLLDDFWGDPRRFPGDLWPQGGARRLGAWEIHPVTRIERWDDSLQRYVELPR